ncbi:MAG TPA: hypothetical protein VHJ40_09085 [Actinomycetota bacterium]|jgi:hypothetical protein|nr:hypothetical protein [Actinomycetota bacterium]
MPDDMEPEVRRSGSEASTEPPSQPVKGGRRSASRSGGRKRSGTKEAPQRPGRGGAAAIIAGVAIIAPILIGELTPRDPFLLMPLSLVILIFGLAGLRAAQGGADGALGRIGFLVASLGALFLAAVLALMRYRELVLNTRLNNAVSLVSTGFLILLIGILIFGLAMVRAGKLNRIAALALLLSIPAGLAIDRFAMLTEPGIRLLPGFRMGVKFFGLALIWIGYSIFSRPARGGSQARPVTS